MARYRIDPERSVVRVNARSTLHPVEAVADGLTGWLDVEVTDPAGPLDLASGVAATIELPLGRLGSGNRFEDRQMQSHIDVARFPVSTGTVVTIKEGDAPGRYEVAGEVNFHGVTRPSEGTITVEIVDDRTLRLEGESSFDLRDFGVKPPQFLMLKVDPDVRVRISIVAELAPAD